MKRIVRLASLAALSLVSGLVLLGFIKKNPKESKNSTVSQSRSTLPSAQRDSIDLQPQSEDLSANYFRNYGTSAQSPREDLVEINDLLADFTTVVGSAASLPTAGNREIVQFLSQQNPSGFIYLGPTSRALGETGEFVDRWGQPLYFHFESADDIGIRSAGEDSLMWTSDDVVFHGAKATFAVTK